MNHSVVGACFLHELQIKTVQHSTDGTLNSIPKTPNASPPIVTAISTSSPGSPTDLPTTLG